MQTQRYHAIFDFECLARTCEKVFSVSSKTPAIVDFYNSCVSTGTGAVRAEYEYPIPVADARELLALCEPPLVEKQRHVVECRGSRWEVDEFIGTHAGLILAEIELSAPDQSFARPGWLGEEVTGDPRYFNSTISTAPTAFPPVSVG